MFLERLFRAHSSPAYKKFSGVHDCGPSALCRVLPSLKYKPVYEAFLLSAYLWPLRGIHNTEMNKAIKKLKLEERFEYHEHIDGKPIGSFIDNSEGTFIILIKHHYSVVSNRKIIDEFSLSRDTKVYYSWKLIKPEGVIRSCFQRFIGFINS